MKIKKTQLEKMIREAIVRQVKQYLTEQEQRRVQPAQAAQPGLKQRIAAKGSSATKDQVSIDKMIMALDGLEKNGAKAVSFDDLVALAKKSIEIAAPLGKGSAAGLAQKATSKTGGAPVAAPPTSLGQQPRQQEGRKRNSNGSLIESLSKELLEGFFVEAKEE